MADSTKIMPFFIEKEGGLSRSTFDTASKNPCPCVYPKTGLTGYHTNKGITWTTFQSSAASIGYDKNDCALFFEMPQNIWAAIYKKKYWDPFYLDQMKSQVFANIIVSWAWGSGLAGAERQLANYLRQKKGVVDSDITKLEILNHFNSLIYDEKNTAAELYEWRESFFNSLNQPTFLKGWLNRLEAFKQFNENLFTELKNEVIKKKSL